MIGKTLAHYKISEKIGAGGMGEVYRATDSKLGRDVALKMLPAAFAQDAERMARFQREAQLLASLNHPNIGAIYGLEEHQGSRFLVLELIEGPTLFDRLASGRLPQEEAISIARQIAEAVEFAHENGVVHRDLKPANVKLTEDGRVKVLDFGLAKAMEDPSASGIGNPAESPTMSPTLSPTLQSPITGALTGANVILGTAAYMSPEQARGKPLDRRTDIFSFGCVFYEVLTGRRAFDGETVSDVLARILERDPDWSALPDSTPERVRRIIQRCLEKDARKRQRDIGDVRLALEEIEEARTSSTRAATTRASRRSLGVTWIVVAALIGAAVGIGSWNALRPAASRYATGPDGVVRLSVDLPSDLRVFDWRASPDGNVLAFLAALKDPPDDEWSPSRVYLRTLDAFEALEVSGTEGVRTTAFSPDGRWLAVVAPIAPRASKLRVYKIPVDGSAPPLTLLDWSDDWWWPMLWLPDGGIVVRTTGGKALVRIPSAGGAPGEPVPIRLEGLEAGVTFENRPETLLPDGIHVLAVITTYTAHGYDNSVGVLNLETGEARVLIENGNHPHWAETGHLVFSRGDAIVATPFDPDRLVTTGVTVAIQSGFRATAIYGDAFFQLLRNGTLFHWPGGVYGDKRQLFFVTNDGLGEPWSDDQRFFEGDLEISTDGRRLAISLVNDAGLYDIWIADMDRRRLSRFVHENGRDCIPQYWTPDGESLLYQCTTSDGGELHLRHVNEAEPRRLASWPSGEGYWAHAFLPDGTLVVNHHHDGTRDLALMSIDNGGDEPERPTTWLPDAWDPEVSPDGRWIAYESDASGRNEIYLRRLGSDHALGREIPVTTIGTNNAWWYPEHKTSPLRLRFTSQGKVWAVEITTDGAFDISDPVVVADNSELRSEIFQSDRLPDGRWLAVMRDENETLPDRVHVVLNWSVELKRRLAPAP